MNSNLISKNISVYFNDLVNKPIISPTPKKSTIITFYKNYVEHNLLLIIIIIFIILFLLFKYFTKNINDDENDNNNINNVSDDNNTIIKEKEKEKETINNKKKLIQKIRKERELLEKEKSEILSIIDELSEMNYKSRVYTNIKEESFEKPQNKNYKINSKNFEAYTNSENYSDDYYNINENKNELIDGIYFETPYN
jgi:hypothetical protein